jgi:hypothetical protein
MANENTPINTRQDSTKHGAGDQPTPASDPKREDEQKTAPAQHEKNEPVRK